MRPYPEDVSFLTEVLSSCEARVVDVLGQRHSKPDTFPDDIPEINQPLEPRTSRMSRWKRIQLALNS